MEAPALVEHRFDAERLARGWLSTALAVSGDDARPALTGVHVEFFHGGVRLVATDSYMLLRTWVARGDAPEPDLDEAPLHTATALDPYGRGVGLMRHMLALATAKDAPPYDIVIRVGDDPREVDDPTLGGMEPQYLIVDVPDQEILTLPLFEGPWQSWRALWASFSAEQTSEISFNPELIVARIGKLGKLHKEGVVRWEFGGPVRPARIELSPSEPRVTGLVMPTKVYLPGYAPEGTEREEPAPTGETDDVTGADVLREGSGVVTDADSVERAKDRIREEREGMSDEEWEASARDADPPVDAP